MAELQERLRDAGRALDQGAPAFDAASLMSRSIRDDDVVDLEPLPAAASSHGSRRALVLGAVAAVLVILVVAMLTAIRVERDIVSTGTEPATSGDPTGAEGPSPGSSEPVLSDAADVLEMDCAGADTTVRSPRVRAQREGVHIVVHNPYPAGAILDYGTPGGRGLPPGDHTEVMSLAPGRSSLTCRSIEEAEEAAPAIRTEYEIVDDQGLWVDPTLTCSLPGAPIGFSDPEVGPYRSTPEAAIRMWQGVLEDTPIRQVGYPDEPAPRYVAELTGGQVLFVLDHSHDGQVRASAAQWCTGVPPAVREATDPGQAWYDEEELGDVRDQLGRLQLHTEYAGMPPAERVVQARLRCADLSLQSRLLGDVAPAPALDLDALRQEALEQVIAASAACPEDEAAVLADGAFAVTDELLVRATDTLDDLRRLAASGG